jgi:hypothetical protein
MKEDSHSDYELKKIFQLKNIAVVGMSKNEVLGIKKSNDWQLEDSIEKNLLPSFILFIEEELILLCREK